MILIRRAADYTADVSAEDLLEKVKALPPRERRKFVEGIYAVEETLIEQKTDVRKSQFDGLTVPFGEERSSVISSCQT